MSARSHERALEAWLEHLRDLGVEALRMPQPASAAQEPSHNAPLKRGPGRGAQQAASGRWAPAASDRAHQAVAAQALEELRRDIGDCTRCKLCKGRTHIVYGVGNPVAELMFIGEAPGRDEDLQGEPFVGRAGQLLTRIIEAIGFKRQDVYIANIIKCRPPGNRMPERDEIATCQGFLFRQIDSIQPKIVISLGSLAAQTLLQTSTPISRMRGLFRDYRGRLLMPTFHPAFLLRNPNRKREVWEDMQKVRDRLFELRRANASAAGAPGDGAR